MIYLIVLCTGVYLCNNSIGVKLLSVAKLRDGVTLEVNFKSIQFGKVVG